jgi:hypothetical protein
MFNFLNVQEMSTNLLSYPKSINFKTGKMSSQSSPIDFVGIGLLVVLMFLVIILFSSKQEEGKLIEG